MSKKLSQNKKAIKIKLKDSLFKHQLEFIEFNTKYTLLSGGYRAGKTYAGIMKAFFYIAKAKKYGLNSVRLGFFYPTYQMIENVFIETLDQILIRFLGVENPKSLYKRNEKYNYLVLNSFGIKVKIFFYSMEKPDRIVGASLNGCFIDELDTLPYEKAKMAFYKINARYTQQIGVFGAGVNVFTTPDKGKQGFCYEYFITLNDDTKRLIKASTLANPTIDKEYIDSIKAMTTPKLAELYLNGEFVNLNGDNVYYCFNDDNLIDVPRETILDLDTIYIGMDFNVNACCCICGYLKDNSIFIFDEFVFKDIFDFQAKIKTKFNKKSIVVLPDASSTNKNYNTPDLLIKEISKISNVLIKKQTKNPLVKDRVILVNTKFYHKKLFVANNLIELKKALYNQTYINGEPEKGTTHPYIDDWNDALGYLVYGVENQNKVTRII